MMDIPQMLTIDSTPVGSRCNPYTGMVYLQYSPILDEIYQWSSVTVRTDHKTYMKISLNNPSSFIRKYKRHCKTVNYNEKVFNAWKRIFGDES